MAGQIPERRVEHLLDVVAGRVEHRLGAQQVARVKPNGSKAGVSHLARAHFPERHPVHVTLRTLPGVGYLRGYRRSQAILAALRGEGAPHPRELPHHLREDAAPRGEDPCASAVWLRIPLAADAPVVRPKTWLLLHAADG